MISDGQIVVTGSYLFIIGVWHVSDWLGYSLDTEEKTRPFRWLDRRNKYIRAGVMYALAGMAALSVGEGYVYVYKPMLQQGQVGYVVLNIVVGAGIGITLGKALVARDYDALRRKHD